MKKITGLVIILALMFFGCYYGMGILTERTVKNNLAIVNHSNGLFAEVVSYHRGLFQSKALLDWSIHVPARTIIAASGQSETIPAQDYRVEMPLTIYHGPIIYSDQGIMFGLGFAHTDLSLPQKIVDQFNSYFSKESTQPKMNISLYVDYLNNSQISIQVPQFNLIAKQGKMMFDWMGMASSVKTTSSLNELSGHFEIEGIGYIQDEMSLKLGEISGKYSLHKNKAGIFYGEASTMVPSVLIKHNDEKMFELTDFSIDTRTDVNNNLFSSYFDTSMKKVFLNDRVFGPGHLVLAIKNLDATVLAQINEEIGKVQQGTDVQKQQAMLAILPQLPKLFAQGVVFEISTASLTLPEGEVSGDLSVALPLGSLTNPFELLQKIQGQGKLEVPVLLMKELVTQSTKQRLMSAALEASSQAGAANDKGAVLSKETSEVPHAVNDSTITKSTDSVPDTSAAKPSDGSTRSEVNNSPESADGDLKSVVAPNPLLEDINKQATVETDKEIAAMLQSGLIVEKGSNYLISIQLNQGQFVVNNKPFNPAMLKF